MLLHSATRTLALLLTVLAAQTYALPAWSASDSLAQDSAELETDTLAGRDFNPAHPVRPGMPGSPRYNNDFISRALYQRYSGQNILPLREILSLGQEYYGRKIEFVMIRASTDYGRGQAELLVNGQLTARPQLVGTWTQDYLFYTDSLRDELGSEIQTLQLRLDGNFSVHSVGVQFAPGGSWGGPDFVQIPVNQVLLGDNLLSVRQLLNLGYQYQGRAVESVVITARTDAGRGQASLRVNGMNAGYPQTVGTWMEDHTFVVDPLRNRLDYDIRTLDLQLQGRFTVQSIGIRFVRGGNPVGSDSVSVRLAQEFNGMTDLNLRQLMNLWGRDGRRVESVVLVASTDAGRGQAQLLVNGFENSLQQTVGQYMGATTFVPAAGANLFGRDIRDLGLRLRGRFNVESVVVNFSRY